MNPDDYRGRCRIAESCLPPAEYRTLLTALHDEMLAEIEALQQALYTEEAISFRRQLHEVQAENEALREALSHISTTVNMHSQELHIARAALARAGEKK
jgi:uncharacterized protein YukE